MTPVDHGGACRETPEQATGATPDSERAAETRDAGAARVEGQSMRDSTPARSHWPSRASAVLCCLVGCLLVVSFAPGTQAVPEAVHRLSATPLPESRFKIAGVPSFEDLLRTAPVQIPLAADVPPTRMGFSGRAEGSRAVFAPGRSARLEGRLGAGETLAAALRRAAIPPRTVYDVSRELRGIFDVKRARPGDGWVIRLDAKGGLVAFQFTTARNDRYRITRQGDRFLARRDGGDLIRRQVRIAGVVSTSLDDAIQALGENPALARDFADIFAYDVDFARGARRGDEFQILYERLFRVDAKGQEHYERPGRIQAARYRTATADHRAVYFESEIGRGAYYRPDGTPLARGFLIAPLRYEKVSSGYSSARFHPILRYTRPHRGIDYAAPVGTPLWAVADGKVIFASRMGGFGNLIKVQHADGYVSFYSHLSRFAPGLRVGQFVRQKQVIGFVGSSGLATGPHVCFRVTKNGQYVNPAQLKGKAFAPAVASNRGFRQQRDALLASLTSREFIAVDEAL